MTLRFPLYTKILGWFFLNLIILGVIFYAFFKIQFRLGLDSLLMGRAGEHIGAVREVIIDELHHTPRSQWSDVMKRFSEAYKVQFYLFREDGFELAGEPVTLPPTVLARVQERRGPLGPVPGEGKRILGEEDEIEGDSLQPQSRHPFPPRRFPPPEGARGDPRRPPFELPEDRPGWAGPPPEALGGRPPPGVPRPAPRAGPPRSMLHTSNPSRYWVLMRIAINQERPRPVPATLVAMSTSIRGGGLFIDFFPWVWVGVGVLVISVLIWLPLVRGITGYISQMTRTTEAIAEGQFDAAAQKHRGDELGRLSQAIHRMAARLSGFVHGQKRFLGDIAHELCSPIARMQMALGILEERAGEKEKGYVEDVREELQQMSSLVNELLSFSKAGLRQKEIKLEPVRLKSLAQRIVEREVTDPNQIRIEIDNSLQALAEPELLARALANLIRNAIRYAGYAGPVTISTRPSEQSVKLVVADQGPGVPAESLEQIFDPFFRLEASRSRDTGGIGLGLSIVKTCVEACQGTVTARNREPHGLEVEITLRADR